MVLANASMHLRCLRVPHNDRDHIFLFFFWWHHPPLKAANEAQQFQLSSTQNSNLGALQRVATSLLLAGKADYHLRKRVKSSLPCVVSSKRTWPSPITSRIFRASISISIGSPEAQL